MKLLFHIRRMLALLESPGFIAAYITWPCFSVTSYLMIARLKKQGVNPATVIDVGANRGQFSVASSRLWCPDKQFAIEPLEQAFARLQKIFHNHNQISLHKCAIGDEESKLLFNVSVHSHSSSLLNQQQIHIDAFPEAAVSGQVEVAVKRLDQVIMDKDLPRPLLLKIDVQGYEMNVLKGASETLKQTDFILLEASLRPMYQGEVTFSHINHYLEALGFSFIRPVDFLEDHRTGEILQMDCLFSRK